MRTESKKYLRAVLAGTLLFSGALTASMSLGVLPASASTLTVTDCSGSPTDTGSLPYAIANASAGDTVTFSSGLSCPPSSPITLTSTITIAQDLTITGPGASTMAVSGGNSVEVLETSTGTVATISGLTIEDGSTSGAGGGLDNNGTLTLTSSTLSGNSAQLGGGIYNNGTLTLTSSTVSGNVTDGPSSSGGGISNNDTLTITSSTISGNHVDNTGDGGGVFNHQGTLTITSSTISGNTASQGGGIVVGVAPVTITSSTISGNSASQGGGIYSGSPLTIGASIMAENPGGNCTLGSGIFTSGGYDLTDDPSTNNTCGFTASTDVLDANPGLGHLTNNGGPTLTQLPAANGPAVGVIAGGTTLGGMKVCPRIDQRGIASIGKCTIGAVEQHGVWQSQVQGYPAFPVKDSPPPGFLIGVQDGIWKLYSHNLSGTDLFTGTITTNGTFSDVALTTNDSGDTTTMVNPQTISFRFHTAGYVSGIKFVSSGSQVTFHSLDEDGTSVPPADILLGNPTTSATSNPLTITRP